MELAPRRFAQVTVLRPSGRIDHLTADRFKTALMDHLQHQVSPDRVVLDLAGVDYIASAGLRALVLAARQVKAHGGRLVVAALQPVVRGVFEITRPVRLTLERHAGRVAVTYEDTGPPFDPTTVAASEPPGRSPGGLGLILVKRLGRELTYTRLPDHKRLTLVIERAGPR